MAEETKEEKREDLSKRGKKDGVYRSGSYKKAKKRGYKVANLNKKQIKRSKAGGKAVSKKQAAAAQSNTVNISDTRFVKGEGVKVGDKLFTGNVKLASGKTAHYVDGRRVMSGGKGSGGGSRGGSGGGGGGGNGGGNGGYRAKTATDKTGKSTYNPGAGTTSRKQTAIDLANKRLASRREAMKNAGGKDSNPSYKQGEPGNRVLSGKKKVGDIRSVAYGTRTRKEKWDGSKWVPVNRFGK